MERLTTKQQSNCGFVWRVKMPHSIQDAIDRLAAYEDTGLEPEEVAQIELALMGKALAEIKEFESVSLDRMIELAQAEKDGRLVVLPCKVGDTVYRLLTTRDTAPIITEIKIKTLGQAADLIGRIGEKRALLSWYSTREEAEAALKKAEEEDDDS